VKERPPAFQFYPRQFAADDHVTAMDLDAVGAHILLMCSAAASPEGSRILADERAIRTRLRNPSNEDWCRIKSQLLAGPWKLSADGQWWEQDGLRRTLHKQREFSEQQRQRALKGSADKPAGVLPDTSRKPAGVLPRRCSSSSSSIKPSCGAVAPQVGEVDSVDPRHSPIRFLIQELHLKNFRVKCQWDPSEAEALNRLLKANPSWSAKQISDMVQNRFASEGIKSSRPRAWLSRLDDYAAGPVDRYQRVKVTDAADAAGSIVPESVKRRQQLAQEAEELEQHAGGVR